MNSMKKNFKLVLALVLSIMMIAGMIPAMAENTGSITLKSSPTVDVTTRVFNAYQILDATYDGDAIAYTVPAALHDFYNNYTAFQSGNNDVEAQATAAGVTFDYMVSQKISALTTAETLRTFLDAALAAAKTAGITAETGAVDGSDYKFTGLAAGYYAIEDVTVDATDEAAKAKSAVMLDTVKGGNVEIVIKANVPSPEKKILTAGELVNEKARHPC